MVPLAAFAWLALVIGGTDVLTHRRDRPDERERAGARGAWLVTAVTVLAAVLLVGQSTALARRGDDVVLPRQGSALAIASVLHQLDEHDLGTVRVEGIGEPLNEAWVGVLYGITRRTDQVFTTDGDRGTKWGRDHIWRDQEVDQVLTIATTRPGVLPDPVARCDRTEGQERLAEFDLLEPEERRRLTDLDARRRAGETLTGGDEAAWFALSRRGQRMVVFSGGAPCGGA